MSPGRLLTVLLLLCTLTACSGGGPEGPSDAGPQPGDAGDSGTPSTPAPVLPSTTLGESTVGAVFGRNLGATGGTPPLTYSAQGLPEGITLDAQTGTLSGSPSTAGSFEFDLSVSDSAGLGDQERYALVVFEAPRFVTSALPVGFAEAPYFTQLEATGGKPPLTYAISGDPLPPGLVLEPSGAIRGTPSTHGTSAVAFVVTDAHGVVKRAPFTLEVRPPPLSINPPPLSDSYRGSPLSITFTGSGGVLPYRWSQLSGTWPPGTTLGNEGVLSGTPTTPGTFTFTVQLTDSLGSTATRTLSVTVYEPPSIPAVTLGDGYVSEPYTTTIPGTNGKPPYHFMLSQGELPPGLSLASNGVLSGTPTASGTASFEVTVRDTSGRTSARTLALSVYALPTLPATLPEARVGTAYSQPLPVSGGKPAYSFAQVSGDLPPGLQLSSGVVSGTPQAGGSASFTVRVTDANDRSSTQTVSLFVRHPPRITTTDLPDATLNTSYVHVLGYTGGQGTLTWGYSGTLPPGLSFGSDGSVRGTPSATGIWSFTVTLEDSMGGVDSRVFSLTVRTLPSDGGTPDGGSGTDGGTPDGGSGTDGGTPDGGTPDGGSGPDAGVPFRVAHWNIEWFGSDTQGPPRSTPPGGPVDAVQFANVREVLTSYGINLWGLVEIVDNADFDALKAQLPGYDGFLSNDPRVQWGSSYYSPTGQKLGVLYDSRLTFQSAELILTSASNDFGGRPPMRVDFLTPIQGVESPLTLIVLHMKAFEDQASYDRRQRAGLALKNYLDAMPSSRVFVVGDWNDDVDESITREAGIPLPSPYQSFVNDGTDYTFVTEVLSYAGESSTTDFPDMIDHTLATNEVMAHYLPQTVQVLRPTWIPDYAGTTSDHYPVVSQYDFGATPTPPTLTLTGPTGGTYSAGSPLVITWEASPGLGTLVLSYSLDFGVTWNFLTYIFEEGPGSYTWTVPNVDSTGVFLGIVPLYASWPRDTSDVPLTFVALPPPAAVFINEYLPNEPSGTLPDGGVGALTDYEFVEIVNGGTEPVDLSGWSIWDGFPDVPARHVFDAGTVLQPGKAWVVFGGPSAFTPGTPNTEAASSGRLALNNSGTEYVTLRDASGQIASESVYSSTQDNVSFNRQVDGDPSSGFVLHWDISGFWSTPGRRANGSPF
ncbi:putative Ig domain-containing protein [Hyalangium rubrum]|uniref:Ig domain-containing protein n=1 Tax=Hyalangium rubrum TaxID=3103134 RepID=A0ABU5GV12_9BACT|nr:putative Ig domain-containing protein [Hyalangium sp. s54d21]MDY7225008.1 putative Ig domain-containing protein [Hyalangium sp. s54d21]